MFISISSDSLTVSLYFWQFDYDNFDSVLLTPKDNRGEKDYRYNRIRVIYFCKLNSENFLFVIILLWRKKETMILFFSTLY